MSQSCITPVSVEHCVFQFFNNVIHLPWEVFRSSLLHPNGEFSANMQMIMRHMVWKAAKFAIYLQHLQNNHHAAVLMPSTWSINDGLTTGLHVARPDMCVFVEGWSLLTKICGARWAVYQFFWLLPAKCAIGSIAGPSRASSVTLLPNVHVTLNQLSAPDGSCTARMSLPIDTLAKPDAWAHSSVDRMWDEPDL